jgi:hypothetical protein
MGPRERLTEMGTVPISRALALLVLLALAFGAGAQTPPLAHFHHVHLNATDPPAAIEFYTSKFKARRNRSPASARPSGPATPGCCSRK